MKKVILVVLVVSLMVGCNISSSPSEQIDNFLLSKIHSKELYYSEEFDKIACPEMIGIFIKDNIRYQSESIDIWNNPKITMRNKYGDCDDTALLYLNILYVRFDIKADVVLVYTLGNRTIINGGTIDHMIIRLPNGTLIEPLGGLVVSYNIRYKYTFNEIFKMLWKG